VCGNARWNTINEDSEEEYKYTTYFRTGAEDIELQRQVQYEDESDKDAERDDDWFFIDCKPMPEGPCEFKPKLWDDFFEELPKNVFDPESVYNWIFRPTNLLFNHSWKIAPAVYVRRGGRIRFISSNCNSSLITREIGWPEQGEDQDVIYNLPTRTRFQRPTVKLIEISFRTVLSEEQKITLQGDKNGVIEFLYKGERKTGRILEASTDGTFNLIEAAS
jgi:hypothetical protein